MSETPVETAPAPGVTVEGTSVEPADPTPAPSVPPEPAAPPEPPAAPEPVSAKPPLVPVPDPVTAVHKVRLADTLALVENFFARHPELDRALMTELSSSVMALERLV
jgi:hypothetical protein